MPQPIVVLVPTVRDSDDPPFEGYVAELLRMEGLNWCETVQEANLLGVLGSEPMPALVVVCAGTPTEHTAGALAEYVRGGGSILACRPPAPLAAALGLPEPLPLPPEWASRYVLLNTASPIAAGLPWVDTGVQFMGQALALHPAAPDGDEAASGAVAWLAPFPGQRSRFPAVMSYHLGAGRAVLFAFDPAASAVHQHQGRPHQASTGPFPDFDGDTTFRPNDLFLGQLDPALRDVPQADLQRTLLLRAVEWLTEAAPLPRLWRFPDNAPAAALFDGDSDNMTLEDFRLALNTCERYGAPYATYLKPEHVELVEPSEERAARDRGHRFGPHPWAGAQPTAAELRDALDANCAAFAARYGYSPRIHRGHWLVWPGWVDHARSLQSAGIQLDASFAAGWGFKGGYVNGTGLPARFIDEEGQLLDLYEQSTISTDDGWLLAKAGLPAHTLAQAISRSYDLIDAAVDTWHTVYHPYFHPKPLRGGGAIPYPTLPWLESTLAHCRLRGIPFLDAERWLAWNAARRAVRLTAFQHAENAVSCSFIAGCAAEAVTVLLPLLPGVTAAHLTVDGQPTTDARPATVTRHGTRYACATATWRAGDTRQLTFTWR